MRRLILNTLRESVKAYPDIIDYLNPDVLTVLWVSEVKIGEAPDDEVRVKDERRIERNFAKFLEGQKKRLLTYIRTHNMKGVQPSWWEDEMTRLWRELGEDFVGILIHGVDGGMNLLPGGGIGEGADMDKINMTVLNYMNGYRDKWLSKIEETSRQYVDKKISDWMLSGDPLQTLINSLDVDSGGMFSKIRARRIAVTEVTRLHAMGNKLAWEEAGTVKQWRWNTANDELVCDICRPNNGELFPLSELDSRLPAHVNCRCWSSPVVSEDLIHERGESVLDEIFGEEIQYQKAPTFNSVDEGLNWMYNELHVSAFSEAGRVNLATIQDAADALSEFNQRTGFRPREFVFSTQAFDDKKNVLAFYNASEKRIYLRGNADYYINKVADSIGDMLFSTDKNDLQGRIIHELAHAYDDSRNRSFSRAMMDLSIDDIYKLSCYAITDFNVSEKWPGGEAFAEAAAAYARGNKDRLTDQMIDILEGMFRR